GISGAVTFTATGTAGAPASIAASTGVNQVATVATAIASPLTVIVKDAFNNVVSSATVTFTVTKGGGTLSGAVLGTNANGIATLGGWTLGNTAGSNPISASVGLVAPVSIGAMGTAGSATQIVLNAGDTQSATVNTTVANAPSVVAKDQFGNVTGGATV